MERSKKFTFRRAAALVLALVMTLSVMTVMASATSNWPSFRGNDNNMAIVDAPTPRNADEAIEKWSRKLGSDWSAAPSVQIIVDDALIVMSGTTLYKLSLEDGSDIATAAMDAAPNFGYTPPLYAAGLIFCPLGNGTVQAFDAETLEAKWTYQDELKGQALTPITYSDGCVYTGFWNGETKDANYVCIDIETGEAKWTKVAAGGYYWAGSVVVGDAVIFGTDDGQSGSNSETSHLYSLNKKTGEVITDIEGLPGDQRSTIAYSAEKGRVYFSTKGGYICSAALDAATGELSDLKTNKVGGMSTSTPVVYGDYLYIGMTSGGNFNGSFGMLMIDADTLQTAATAELVGYPQMSALVSTAYLKSEGKLYLYATYNNNPGGLTVLTVEQTADGSFDPSTFQAEDLFIPSHPQYCITSPICDENGTIYYKNDSGYVFAVARDTAYATDITVGYDDGGETTIDGFAASTLDYELTAPADSKQATVDVDVNDGCTVTINGKSTPAVLDLTEGKNEVEIIVTGENSERTYTLSIQNPSADNPTDNTGLSNLNVTSMNRPDQGICTLNPAFNAANLSDTYLVTGVNSSFARVFVTAADSKATVKVYAIDGVSKNFNSTTKEISIGGSTYKYYSVYFVDDTTPARIRIEVTGRYGSTQNYFLTCVKASAYTTAVKQNENVKVYLAGTARAEIDSLSVSDTNKDGAVSVGEALFTAHINRPYPPNLALQMFATTDGKITKLFGNVVDPANVGMFVNDKKIETTETPLAADDRVVVFTYSDTENHSDKYTYFANAANTSAGDSGAVKLLGVDYAGKIAPLAGAAINVYTDSACKNALTGANVTDNGDGTYTITAPAGTATEAGTTLYLRSATNGSTIVVPADCTLTLKADSAASAVVDQIAALGDVTADSKSAVDAARAAYNALTGDQKALVSNYDALVAAEAKLEALKDVAAVEEKLAALDPEDLTLDDAAAVKEARKAYKALTKAQKDLVSEADLENLAAAEAAIESLKQIDAVEKKIAALADATAEDAAAIAAARRAYEALTPEQQAKVSNLDILEAAEAKVTDQDAAAAVEDLINAIGEVTKDSGSAIREARAAYDALTDAQKDLVTNLDVLEAAEQKYHNITTGTSKVQDVVREDTKKDTKNDEETSSNDFVDVSRNSWYYDAVNAAVSSGLMTGTSSDRFSPNAAVTRGMIVTILARMDGEKTSGTPWYAAGQSWAMTNGISDGTNMTGTLTREQLAAMLYRYAQLKGYDVDTSNTLTGYADAANVSAYALDAMRWANGIGLIQGRNGQLAPQGTASRAELATILDRFMTIFG